jgi:hypothetical protein
MAALIALSGKTLTATAVLLLAVLAVVSLLAAAARFTPGGGPAEQPAADVRDPYDIHHRHVCTPECDAYDPQIGAPS